MLRFPIMFAGSSNTVHWYWTTVSTRFQQICLGRACAVESQVPEEMREG